MLVSINYLIKKEKSPYYPYPFYWAYKVFNYKFLWWSWSKEKDLPICRTTLEEAEKQLQHYITKSSRVYKLASKFDQNGNKIENSI